MTIDFHAEANRSTYTGRRADAGWAEAMRKIVDPNAKAVADMGCGGGIYARAWREMGAGIINGAVCVRLRKDCGSATNRR